MRSWRGRPRMFRKTGKSEIFGGEAAGIAGMQKKKRKPKKNRGGLYKAAFVFSVLDCIAIAWRENRAKPLTYGEFCVIMKKWYRGVCYLFP